MFADKQAIACDGLSVYAKFCTPSAFKVERLHGQQRFMTRRQAKDEVIDWILWYNRERLHSTLAYVSPMQFE